VHRSRLSLLAIVTVSACSSRGDAKGTEILSQDPSLAAGLQDHQKAQQLPLPDVCGAIAPVVQPTVAAKRQAQELTRQAYDVELVGNADSARSLLAHASQLDATDRSAAYHLGRANETLGDRTGALTAYCRYIALTPTMTESAEARQRVATLSQRETRVAAGSVSYVTPAAQRVSVAPVRRAGRTRTTVARPVAAATVHESSRVASSARTASRHRTTSADGIASSESATPSQRGTYSSNGAVDGVDGTAMPSDGAGVSPNVEQPATPVPTVSRGPSRMQTAGIGAIAGAIMGAAAGRSVKSAVIGAAAGGVLGTVVGGSTRPTTRSIRPWASSSRPAGDRWTRVSSRRLAPAS
jgi:hypothetical protein